MALTTTETTIPDPAPFDAAGVTPIVETEGQRRSRLLLAGGLLFMGVLHFAAPTLFDRIIPKWVPGAPRMWTYVSGVWELSSAALLATPRTRRLGAYAAAATLVAVYPANIQMALDNKPTTPYGVGLWARLPMQLPMIGWALKHRK
jgi:uncharacterized membrane protein